MNLTLYRDRWTGWVKDPLIETHGLTFAPDPATHRYCTIGGMIGNNSCGVHSVMAGKTDDNGKLVPMGVKVGDKILFGKYSGQEFKLEGADYLHMREDDVIGVVA